LWLFTDNALVDKMKFRICARPVKRPCIKNLIADFKQRAIRSLLDNGTGSVPTQYMIVTVCRFGAHADFGIHRID
jgi:hypothetical protein